MLTLREQWLTLSDLGVPRMQLTIKGGRGALIETPSGRPQSSCRRRQPCAMPDDTDISDFTGVEPRDLDMDQDIPWET